MTRHHYSFSFLREFIEQGRETGAVGSLLIASDDEFEVWKGYGTLENPRHKMVTHMFKKSTAFSTPKVKYADFGIFVPIPVNKKEL